MNEKEIIKDLQAFAKKHFKDENKSHELETIKSFFTQMIARLEAVHKIKNDRTEYMKKYLSRLTPEQLKYMKRNIPKKEKKK